MESTDSAMSQAEPAGAADEPNPATGHSPSGTCDSSQPHSPTDVKLEYHLDSSNESSNLPLQKRRRVTRACDECRRKKIKCDGKQPCPHCLVYSYECTYDKPSNRRRNPTPQYINIIERKLKRAELLLRLISPDLDLNDPHIDESLQDGADSIESVLRDLSIKPKSSSETPLATPSASIGSPPPVIPGDDSKTDKLESMLKSNGQLDLDDEGHYDFYGGSSGILFVRKMRERLANLIGKDKTALLDRPNFSSQSTKVWDNFRAMDSPTDSSSVDLDLPPPDLARYLCDLAINDANILLRVIHMPTFHTNFDRLYSLSPSDYSNEDHTFLPLFYSLLAFGSLYAKDENSELDSKGYTVAIGNGFKYYKAATRLIDVTDSRDLNSLQAVVYLVQFLQSSARLSTCYSYVGCAMRSALRMGLHRKLDGNFNPVESEIRKRVFWVLRRMDVHISAILGLPYSLNEEDIDQEFPTITDDEYITPNGILPMPVGSQSAMAFSDAHIRLLPILSKAIKYIYPVRPLDGAGSFMIPASLIREIEVDLQTWNESLPMHLKPGGDYPPEMVRAQQHLRLSYAHIQMMMYRPFLHYVSQSRNDLTPNKLSYTYAATCISVSRNIVHIVTEMNRQHLLIGAYWFTMYTAFFGILSLLFYVLENPEDDTTLHILRDAYEGKATLALLAKRSLAADRCSAILTALFSRLPDHLVKKYRNQCSTSAVSSKKRAIDLCSSAPRDRNHMAAARPSSGCTNRVTGEVDQDIETQGPGLVSNSMYMSNGDGFDFLLDDSGPSPSIVGNQASDPRTFFQGPGLVFPDGDPFAYPQQTLDLFEQSDLDLAGFSDFMNDFNPPAPPGAGSVGLGSMGDDNLQLGSQSGVPVPNSSNNQGGLGGDGLYPSGSFLSMNDRGGTSVFPLSHNGMTGLSTSATMSQMGQSFNCDNNTQDLQVPVPDSIPSYMLAPNSLLLNQMGGPSLGYLNSLDSGLGGSSNRQSLNTRQMTNDLSDASLRMDMDSPMLTSDSVSPRGGDGGSVSSSPFTGMGTSTSGTSTFTTGNLACIQQMQRSNDPGLLLQQKMLRSLQFDPLAYCPSTSGLFPSSSPSLASIGNRGSGMDSPLEQNTTNPALKRDVRKWKDTTRY